MQQIIVDKPYEFVPPYEGRFWSMWLKLYLPHYLNRYHGVVAVTCRGDQYLRDSISAGHGIVLTPNHCRPYDPMVLAMLGRQVRTHFFIMASWHLFMQGKLQRWLIRRAGAFSVYREGMDRAAMNAAIEILFKASRPLVMFPEGVVSRSNDRLNALMEGPALIARAAARKRAKESPDARVVVHPVAIRYAFVGDLEASITPVLEKIESRLTWPRQPGPLLNRIYKVGQALLCLKEIEYLDQPQSGSIGPRIEALINHILAPHEASWLQGRSEGTVVARVKRLRAAIVPDLLDETINDEQRERRWRVLADVYLAQQLSHYPPDYVKSRPSPERMLETVERFEEDLTDTIRAHQPLKAIIQVGPAIEVQPTGDRKSTGGATSNLMEQIEAQITTMVSDMTNELARNSES